MQSAKRLHQPYQDSKYRAGKTTARPKRTTPTTSSTTTRRQTPKPASPPEGTTPSPFVVTLIVGRDDQRLFAAHETVLAASPFFAKCCRSQPRFEPKRISLPDEQPEVLSCVLEYLYRGDYSPYLVHDPAKGTWRLQCGGGDRTGATRVTGIEAEGQNHGATIFHESAGAVILRDTAI